MTLSRSLRARVLAATMLGLTGMLLVGMVLIASLFASSAEQSFDRSLTSHLNHVAAVVGGKDVAAKVDRQLEVGDFERPYSGLYWQISGDDGLVRRSRSLWDADIELPVDAIDSGQVHTHRSMGPAGQSLRVLERRVVAADGTRWRIAVAADRTDLDKAIAHFNARLIEYSFMLLGLSLLVGLLQLYVVQRPIHALTQAIASLRSGNISRLVGRFPSEVDELVGSLNALLQSNERISQNARLQAAGLAHAIKTPVAVLGNELDLLQRGGDTPTDWPAIRDNLGRIDRASRFYLARARITHRAGSAGRQVRVRPIVFGIVQTVRRLHEARALSIDYDCAEPVTWVGDATDLEEILGNLVDNAAKWARSQVMVHCTSERDMLCMTVQDDGPGIAPGDRQAILAPGARLDSQVSGSGFGLAIVSDIVQSHGGTLALAESPGGGLRVSVQLPLDPVL